MKQGEEGFTFVKDPENEEQRNYIFQENNKTKIGFYIVIAVLVLLVVAVIATSQFL